MMIKFADGQVMLMNLLEQQVEQRKIQIRDQFIKENLLSDEVLDTLSENIKPFDMEMSYYKCAAMEVETKFRVLDEQFSLEYDCNPIESIKTRIKSVDSILKKIRRKNIPLNIDDIETQIRDIAGVRVICSFIEDIYMLADCFLSQDDITLIEIKDYIKNPKPSGYRSLHLIVEVPIFLHNEKKPMKVEVQIRTLAMDLWASQEHKLRYKKNIPADEEGAISDELADCAQIIASIDQRMETLRTRMKSPEYMEKAKNSTQNIGRLRKKGLLNQMGLKAIESIDMSDKS